MIDITRYNHILIVAFFVFMNAWTSSLAGNNSSAAFSTWPDTGQTKCYNYTQEIPCPAPEEPFYGQDAQYNGPVRSYTLLGGGIMVQDNVTGLIWEMKTDKNGTKNYSNPNDADNTYTWCDTNTATNGGNAGTCATNDTADFIDQLNSGTGFGGFTDWRLPTVQEIDTLYDYVSILPAIHPIFAVTGTYSSSTTYSGNPDHMWIASPSLGSHGVGRKSDAYYVVAVRGDQKQAENRFVDNGDTVTDTVTCLQWQKSTMDTKDGAGPDTYTWQEALAASESLSLAGHADWRLPDINELRSLIDYSRTDLAIAPVFEATTLPSKYLSSTTSANYPEYSWYTDFYDGYTFRSTKWEVFYYYVRAVRGGQCGIFITLGDVNKDGFVNLSDGILALQIITGIVPADTIAIDNDVNGDNKVGLEEAIYALRKVAASGLD